MAAPASQEFDLSSLKPRQGRRNRPLVLVLLLPMGLGLGLTVTFSYRLGTTGNWSYLPGIIALALGVVLLAVVLWALSVVLRPPPDAMRVLPGGMEFRFDAGPWIGVSWTDPRLVAYLLDCSKAPRARNGAYTLAVPRARVSAEVTPEAYQAVLRSAEAAHLTITVRLFESGSAAGAVYRTISSNAAAKS